MRESGLRKSFGTLGWCCGVGALAAGALAATSFGAANVHAQLVSHRALYQLELDRSDGDLVAARGALALEWEAECGAWISQQRLGFLAATADGGTFDFDVRFASWERDDGSELGFTMRRYVDGSVVEEYRGTATMPESGDGAAGYRVPDALDVVLPAGTMFPTTHLRSILENALAGENFVGYDLFDGAGNPEEALAHVTAVIGQQNADDAEPLWPVALAYYAPTAEDGAPPHFELTFDLEKTGVMRDLVLDYGDFALRANLEDLEMLEAKSCD